MRTFNNVVIFSVDRSEHTEQENQAKRVMVNKLLSQMVVLNGITWNEAKGMYKGESEVSYVVVMNNREKFESVMDEIREIATITNQESILVQDTQGVSYLCYLKDGRKEKLGMLRQVDNVNGLDAYTELNGKYYSIV